MYTSDYACFCVGCYVSTVRFTVASNDTGCGCYRGSAELIDALDTVLDKSSPIFAFRRDQNAVTHDLAMSLLAECTTMWKEGGGPQKRLNLLDKAPWTSLLSVVKSIDSTGEAGESSDILNRVAMRIEKASAKEISDACSACQKLVTLFKKDNQPAGQSTLLMGVSKSLGFPKADPRKQFRQRLKAALKQLALRGSKSSVWAQRREALESLACVIKSEKEFKEMKGQAKCLWLEDQQVLEDLFGERAHATIVSETVGLLSLIELTDSRVNVLVDSALMHVGSVRAEVHKVVLAVLAKCSWRAARIVLDRIMGVFDVPDVLKSDKDGTALGTKPSSPAFSALAALHSGDCLQAAFELVTAIFDTSKLHGLFTTVDIMTKGNDVSFRAMDVLVAALLTPFCEDQEVFNRLVQDSLFHCLQSTWGELDGNGNGQGKQCKEYVAHLCCRIVQNKGGATSQMAMKGAFAVLMEVIRLFPRSNFAAPRDITRESCIHMLQTQFDILQACMLNLRSLSQSLDGKVMESDDVLQTELWTRLGQLRYLLENTSADQKEYNIMLEVRQVDQLWEALNGSTECCLRWLRLASDSGGIFDDDTQAHLFRRYMCKMDPTTIRPHGFNCFQALFADVNNVSQMWETSGRSGQKSGCKINGPAFVGRRVRVLWKDEKMHNGTICSYSSPTTRDPKVQKHTVRWDDTGKEDTHDWTDLHDWHLLEDELSVNILAYEILSTKKSGMLEGLDFLWGACLQANDDIVATKAHDMMLDLTRHMSFEFQQVVLARLSEEMQKALQAMDVDSSNRVLRVRRCLQLIKNLLRGQIRICDTVFSYTQYAKSRSHGFRGDGKRMTISLSSRDDTYKSNNPPSRTLEVGSRQALDEILVQSYPQQLPTRVAVTLDGKQLVRGPNTTLEELGVTDGAELKVEYESRTSTPHTIAFGHLGETIATIPSFFKMLFDIMDESSGLHDMQGLVWEVLMTLPSQEQDEQTVSLNRAQWRSVLCAEGKIWRSLYLLQIVESELETHDYRAEFLSNNGFAVVVELMEELHKQQILAAKNGVVQQAKMLRVIGVPIVLRVLRLCTGDKGQLSQAVMSSPCVPTALAKACELVILLSSNEPVPNIVSAIIDGAEALSVFLSSAGSGVQDSNDQSIFSRFFIPRAASNLADLQLGTAEVQESSKMASDAGILVHKILLQYPNEKVRVAIAEVLLEIASSSSELGTQLVDLMSECLNVKHNECTRCRQFFALLTRLLTSAKPIFIKEQPIKMYKVAELSTTMLLSADKLPLSNEMLHEVMTVLTHTLQRPDQNTSAQLSKLASRLMPKLSKEFLMRVPGSKRTSNVVKNMARRSNLGQNSHLQVAPLCEVPDTRDAAWMLLHTIVTKYCSDTMLALSEYIHEFAQATRLPVKIHWNRVNSTPKEDWEHRATVERRKLACVGLKNQGATCYMNAMMQQLFLDDSLRKTVLTAPLAAPPPEKAEELWKCPICTLENDWGSRVCMACEQGERPEKVDPVPHGDLLRQMQRTFRYMVDSELQSFDPISLVESCRDLGLHFRVTSQNDSSEFLDKLLERLEREVGGKEHSECLKSCFRVRVSSQLVSVECPHRKPINAGVFEKSFKVNVERMGTLERAIEDALAGELMTGDSRVDCEKCTLAAHTAALQNGTQPEGPTKRAMKRTLFLDGENLPSTLCVQLNRFQFQGNGFVKLNDRLAFQTVLDLAPYTKPPKGQEGEEDEDMSVERDTEEGTPLQSKSKRRIDTDEPLLYELKGIVVHSGQFSFGHYYSFAKDPITGKWLKLDDDVVSEFDLVDLESECFGGIQTTVNKWTNCVYKTEKTASAYMLLYQRCDGAPISTPKKERTTGPREAATPDSVSDTGMDDLQIESPAAAMVDRLESAAGVDEILDTNEQMLRRSLFFDEGFSGFVLDLVVAMDGLNKLTKETIDMALTVFYKSVLHAENHPRLRTPGGYSKTDWLTTMGQLLDSNEDACVSFLEMCLKQDDGPDNLPNWLQGGLVSCPVEDVRQSFGKLLCMAIRKLALRAETDANYRNLVKDIIAESVDALKELVPVVSQCWRHFAQFGIVIETMAGLSVWRDMIIQKDLLALLLHLYLGPMSPGNKSPQLPKIALMGTSNPWPNGRVEPDCEAMLRGIQMLINSKSEGSTRWPQLTNHMVPHCYETLLQKLCSTDPMGGSGGTCEALVIHILLDVLKNHGPRNETVENACQSLIDHLEKQGVDHATRMRQSQSAQVMALFLCTNTPDATPGERIAEENLFEDLRIAKEELLRQLAALECYNQPSRNGNFTAARRFAQVLVLAGQDELIASMLNSLKPDLERLANALLSELPRIPANSPSLTVQAGSDVGTLLSTLEASLTRAKQPFQPNELYVSVTTHHSSIKGIYRMDGPSQSSTSGNETEHQAGLVFIKTLEQNVGYQIMKVFTPLSPYPPPVIPHVPSWLWGGDTFSFFLGWLRACHCSWVCLYLYLCVVRPILDICPRAT